MAKRTPLIIWITFMIIAISLYITTNKIFYLINFSYIGSCLAIGLYLLNKKFKYARHFVQLSVGLYMFVYLGLILKENMQLTGFFYYLFLGVFQAAVIHYLVAKIIGPFLFGRGWCGYACWTAMILDLLPYKNRKDHNRIKNLGLLRYLFFCLVMILVASLFILKTQNLDNIMYKLFIAGNIIAYLSGIILAIILKDNRAFCKYLCPTTTFLKPASYYSYLRIKVDKDKCIYCNQCVDICPMDVDMLDEKRSRKNGTECILCQECSKICPVDAI